MREFNGTPGEPAELRAPARAAATRRPTGSPTGASPRTRSTTGASSTSTIWPHCAWKTRRCSRPPTAWCWSYRARDARRPAHRPPGRAATTRPQYFAAAAARDARRWPRPARDAAATRERGPPLYVVVEKILASYEHLPEDWPVHGTTGLRIRQPAHRAAGRQRRRGGAADGLYAGVHRRRTCDFDDLLYRRKKLIMQRGTCERAQRAGEPAGCASPRRTGAPATSPSTVCAMRCRSRGLLSRLPHLHRRARPISADDRRYVEWAVARRQEAQPGGGPPAFSTSSARCCSLSIADGRSEAYREAVTARSP